MLKYADCMHICSYFTREFIFNAKERNSYFQKRYFLINKVSYSREDSSEEVREC